MARTNRVIGPSLLDKMWDTLDTATAQIMSGQGGETAKGYARGVAECIRILSHPVFHSTDAVVSCAVTRHGTDAAFSGSPAVIHHAPPNGIISSEEIAVQAQSSPPVAGTDAAPIPVPAPSVEVPLGTVQVDALALTDEQVRSIRAAAEARLPVEAISAAFSVTVGVVEQVIA